MLLHGTDPVSIKYLENAAMNTLTIEYTMLTTGSFSHLLLKILLVNQ